MYKLENQDNRMVWQIEIETCYSIILTYINQA